MPALGSPGRVQGHPLTSTALLLQFPASSTSPAPLGSSCRPTTQRTTATTSTASGSSWPGPRAASTWLSTTSTWSLSLTSWSSRMGPRPRPRSWAPSQETSFPPPSRAVGTWPVSSSRPTTQQGRGVSTSPSPVSPHSVPLHIGLRAWPRVPPWSSTGVGGPAARALQGCSAPAWCSSKARKSSKRQLLARVLFPTVFSFEHLFPIDAMWNV